MGTDDRSATVVGQGENQNEFVIRGAIRIGQKLEEYARMNMTHFTEDAKRSSDVSCVRALFANHRKEGLLE